MDTDRPPRESANERLGAAVRTLREQKGISQAELARLMTERGWPWHQSTVYRVESGRQTVGFSEALDLAGVLRTSLDRFTWGSAEANESDFVYAARARLVQQYEVTAEAVCRMLAEEKVTDRTVRRHKDSKWERVQVALDDLMGTAKDYHLEAAIEEGVRRYEERTSGEEGDEDQPAEDAPADDSDQAGPQVRLASRMVRDGVQVDQEAPADQAH
jgi:transcriptional regulator with XRE-family HTH domain